MPSVPIFFTQKHLKIQRLNLKLFSYPNCTRLRTIKKSDIKIEKRLDSCGGGGYNYIV